MLSHNQPKCAQYWPEMEASIKFGNIQVRNVGEICHDHFVVRHLEAVQVGCTAKSEYLNFGNCKEA